MYQFDTFDTFDTEYQKSIKRYQTCINVSNGVLILPLPGVFGTGWYSFGTGLVLVWYGFGTGVPNPVLVRGPHNPPVTGWGYDRRGLCDQGQPPVEGRRPDGRCAWRN